MRVVLFAYVGPSIKSDGNPSEYEVKLVKPDPIRFGWKVYRIILELPSPQPALSATVMLVAEEG